MKRKPDYVEGEEAAQRFDTLMQGVLKVKPEDLKARLAEAMREKEESKPDGNKDSQTP